MTLSVALVGNVALNATVLGHLLREHTGVEAYTLDIGAPVRIWTPFWEWADFDPLLAPAAFNEGGRTWSWKDVEIRNGYRRRPWERIVGHAGTPAWFDTQEAFEEYLDRTRLEYGRLCSPILDLVCRGREDLIPVPELKRADFVWPREQRYEFLLPLPRAPKGWRPQKKWETKLEAEVWHLPRVEAVRELSRHHDLVVLMGPEVSNGLALPRDTPYIAFEHGTLRHVAKKNTMGRRLLAAAHQWADWNVITNADCLRDAKSLGLANYSFIPHPCDTDGKFRPLEAPCRDVVGTGGGSLALEYADPRTAAVHQLRQALLDWSGAEVLFLAPSRQSTDPAGGEKGNAKLLVAYKRYVEEAEPKGAPKALLILAGWGTELIEGHRGVRLLGIGKRVTWFPALPKLQLAQVYLAADVVCDQFAESVGSFGTCTVEALSCAKPVVTWVDPVVNAWAFPALPPVCNALSTEEIYEWLVRLAQSPDLREEQGAKGRAWVQEYHSGRLVAQQHASLYRRILEAR